MRKISKNLLGLPLLCFTGLLSLLIASETHAEDLASLYSLQGSAEGGFTPEYIWTPVDEGQGFNTDDKVRTAARSRAGIRFSDGYLIRLAEKTTLTFKPRTEQDSPISILSGKGYFSSRTKRTFPTISTPQISASVRGTEFVIEVSESTTTITVLDGEVFAENAHGSVTIGKGEQASAEQGKAPVKSILLNPTDAVQWAVYYPPVFENQSGELAKASEMLSVGDIEGAKNIHQTLARSALSTSDKEVLSSQKALIALVSNDIQKAKSLIAAPLRGGNPKPSTLLVASYISQAEFNLDETKNHLETLIAKDSSNVLAKARLAEIYLAFGEKDEARALLDEADVANSAYGTTVLGFLLLSELETEKAETAFESAIIKDQSFALPRLGLGIAQINLGKLEEGRTQIEYAAQLEPTVAMYRSYLGKAYFEENNGEKSEKEFRRAIELDPLDPTPYLYRSHLHLTEHRPVHALRDINASIDRNNNRAVYRSRLMLDADEGTRSSSLGQVYNRVGFTELARVEALKSLYKDYSNYSAHFLLADLYRDTQLTSGAQVTENLLGRLLSPVTFNANNINLGGEASLNEYTTLFNRPVSRVGVGANADSQSENIGGTVEYVSAENELGYNLGYSVNNRAGFRDNDFEKNHQLFSLGQYKLSKADTLVWDAAGTFNERGDLEVNYDPYAEDKDIETDFESLLVRSGFHHQFGPGTHFIAQAFYNYGETDVTDLGNTNRISSFSVLEGGQSVTRDPFDFDGTVDERLENEQHLGRADAQFIIDRELVSVVTGSSVQYDEVRSKEKSVIASSGDELLDFVNGFPLRSGDTIDQLTHRTFVNATWHVTEDLDVDTGVTYTWLKQSNNAFTPPFEDEQYEDDALSPKAGLLYQLAKDTSFRAAYAETLDRTARGSIGPLEPTYVGGFNQVFDGIQGSEQDFWGVGLDQKFPETETYVGINYQRREIDLNTSFIEGALNFERTTQALSETRSEKDFLGGADEDRVQVYLYQILGDEFTLASDYTYEMFDEVNPFPEFSTNRVSTRLNYFHPTGLFGFGRTSWRHQVLAGDLDAETTSAFWLFDAGFGYEFDKRQGALTLVFNNIFDESFRYSHTRDEDAVRPEFSAQLELSYTF